MSLLQELRRLDVEVRNERLPVDEAVRQIRQYTEHPALPRLVIRRLLLHARLSASR